jgi:hypothetical protein
MPPSTGAGYYLADLSVWQGSRETKTMKSFRVSLGGPYDVTIDALEAEVPRGETQDFTISIEDMGMGEYGADVKLSYWISKDNVTYAAVYDQPVFVPSGGIRTLNRSLAIYSDQPLGDYFLSVRVTPFSGIETPLETNATFRVIEGGYVPPVVPGGGGVAGPGGGVPGIPPTGLVTEKLPGLEIANIFPDELMVERGGTRYVIIEVKNTGEVDLTKVSPYFTGIPADWFESIREIDTLSPGSTGYLIVKFSIPFDTEQKAYMANLTVLSSEIEKSKEYKVEVFESMEALLRAKIKKM